MKGLLKLVLVAVLGYLAYKYYVKNYTTDGKMQTMDDNEDLYGDKAEQLKYQWINEEIDSRLIGVTGVFRTMSEPMIRKTVEQEAQNIDWLQRATLLS